MNLGFSSVACPDWDLETIIRQAATIGYRSLELGGLGGQLHLPAVPQLAGEAESVAARCRDAGIELTCLATRNMMHWTDSARAAQEQVQVRETIQLAARLGCPFVRILPGVIPGGEQKQATLMRIAARLRELAPLAAGHHTTLLVENSGDFIASRDLWFILDNANHPAVRCCWNPCWAYAGGESASLAVPRLGRFLGLLHVSDLALAANGHADLGKQLRIPGQGQLDLEHVLNLLRGIGYAGDVIFYWPRQSIPSLAAPEEVLPAAYAALRGLLDKLAAEKELTAYKGDKNVPKYAASRLAPAGPSSTPAG